jgi:hypothetical protein
MVSGAVVVILNGGQQPSNPGDDLAVIRAQPALEQLAGLPVQAARHHRTRVHVQPNTRTIRQH